MDKKTLLNAIGESTVNGNKKVLEMIKEDIEQNNKDFTSLVALIEEHIGDKRIQLVIKKLAKNMKNRADGFSETCGHIFNGFVETLDSFKEKKKS